MKYLGEPVHSPKRRHPNLVLRAPSSLSKARALASNRAVLYHYFDLLEETRENNHLKDKPCQILIWMCQACPLTPSHLKLSMSKVTPFLMHNCWLCKCWGPMSASNGHMESEDFDYQLAVRNILSGFRTTGVYPVNRKLRCHFQRELDQWYHCDCVHVDVKKAKEDNFSFIYC